MGNLISKVTLRLSKLSRSGSRSRPECERLPRTLTTSKAKRNEHKSSFSTKRPPQVYRYGCPPVPPSTPVSPPREASDDDNKDMDEDEGKQGTVIEIEDAVPALKGTPLRIPPSSAAYPQLEPPLEVTDSTPANENIEITVDVEEMTPHPPKNASPNSIKTTKTARILFTPVQPSIEKAPPHTISTTTLTTEIKISMENATESKDVPSTPEFSTSDDLPPLRCVESYLSLASSVSTFADERQQRWSRMY